MVGWHNDPGLDEEGKRQVRELAEQLGKQFREHSIRAVYTSPLPRTRQTAEMIATHLKLPLHFEPGLKDINIGEWAGQPFTEIHESGIGMRYFRDPVGVRLPGGEEITEVRNRVVPAIEQIERTHLGGAVIIVSHLDVIRLILSHYSGGDLHDLHTIGPVPLASCTSVEDWIKREVVS
jgi:broad specificity phosphatase PhoE